MKYLILSIILSGCLLSASAQPQSTAPLLEINTGAPMMSVDYSPDGRSLVTGGQSHDVAVWNALTGERMMTLKGHSDDVVAVRYSPNGRYIASGGVDNTLILWDAITGDMLRKLTEHTDYVRDVAFSPDGRLVASASWDGRTVVWETFSGNKIATIDAHRDNVTSVAFNASGTELLTASADRTIRVWDTKNWKQQYMLTGHTDDVWDACFSPNGRYVASGAWDNTARLWDLENKKTVFTYPAHVSDTWSVVFSPDGQLIASGGGDNKVKLWDVSTGLLVSDLSGNQHTAEVEKVVFNPDGSALASVSRDGTVKVWRTPKTEARIAACVTDAMQKWSVRGEFEKSDHYRKRMDRKDRQAEQTTRDCRDRIINKFGNTVDWQAFAMGPYDADNEVYPLKSKLFSDKYYIKVAPRDAERVRNNFAKTTFGVPTFDLEYNGITLKRVDITVPLDDYKKTYTIYR